MKKTLLLLSFCILVIINADAQTTIASWSFENVTTSNTGSTPDITGGSAVADGGSQTAGSAFTAFHSSTACVYSNPAGNATSKSLSSNNWSVNDYYEFKVSTSGYSAIGISFDVNGSNTGPADFKVQYSTNGTSFTDLASGTYIVANDAWAATGSPKTNSIKTFNLSTVSALNNAATVFIRLVNTTTVSINSSTVAAAGTSRIDNFAVLDLTTLPISLTSFTAKVVDQTILLNWTTASEKNNKAFEVLKSYNGKIFSSIQTIAGAGNSDAEKAYSFVDENPYAGTNYYQLKQIDSDGASHLSNIISVTSKIASTELNVNASENNVNAFINAANAGNALLNLFDINGKLYTTRSIKLNKGFNTITFNESLNQGVYFIQLSANGLQISQKFIK